jgi:hypothetical protein
MIDLPAAIILAWIRTCALHYGVDPELAQAVAIVESRPAGGGLKIRVGPLGKKGQYVGPMGINRTFANKYDIYNPYENVRVGVAALRGRNQAAVLKRYNRGFDQKYYREVCRVQRHLKSMKQYP